jgi:phosphoribosylaminoimidazolecarboxamide formyltransferase/IMP cyclohydrolase
VDPNDYDSIIEELTTNKGMTSLETRFRLAQKAFSHTAGYDRAIADYLGEKTITDLKACYSDIM